MKRFLLIIMFTFSAITHAQDIPDNFLYLREVIPDILLDVRYSSGQNFIGEPISGYETAQVILTGQAAMALQNVQNELAYAGLGLKVFDGYRPQRAVDQFVRWARDDDDTRMKVQYYPNVAKKDIIPKGFIAEQSSHSRGSTVDLTIVTLENGEELDMGSPFDFFDQVSWPSDMSVSPAQRASRMLLRSVMTRHGFIPLEEEWWHFTLKNEPFPDTYFDFPVK